MVKYLPESITFLMALKCLSVSTMSLWIATAGDVEFFFS